MRSRCLQSWFLLRPLTLARGLSSTVFSRFLSVHVCVQVFSSYKGTSQVGLGPTLMTSF